MCTGSRFDLLAHSSARMAKLWPRETIWTVQLSSGEVQHCLGGAKPMVVAKTTPMIEGRLEAKLPTIWTEWKSTARKKLRQGDSEK